MIVFSAIFGISKNKVVGSQRFTIETLAFTTPKVVSAEIFDPRNPANRVLSIPGETNIQRLLFFHNATADTQGTASIKAIVDPDTIDIQYDFDKLQPVLEKVITGHYGDFGKTAVSKTFTFVDDTEGDTEPDFTFKYGINSNEDEELINNEKLGEVHLHLVTQDNYDDAIWEINNLILFPLNDISDALFRRFVTGSFANADTDYIPTLVAGGRIVRGSENLTTTTSPHQFTHNFGATFTGVGLSATANVPLYQFNVGSTGALLMQGRGEYKDGVEAYLNSLSATDIQTLFGSGVVGTEKVVILSNVSVPLVYDPFFDYEIGLGHATGIGTVAFYIKRSALKTYIIKNVRTVLNVEDLFDFNYFNAGGAGDLGFSQDGASIQASFGMAGVPSGVGECFIIRYETDRTFDDITIQKEVP